MTNEDGAVVAGTEKQESEDCEAIARVLLPRVIHALLDEGKLDRSRVADKEYLRSAVLENLNLIEYEAIYVFDQQFVEAARDAVEAGRLFAAVVLVSTAVEHKLNLFYRLVLEAKHGLSPDQATEAIRANFAAKLGWLFALVCQCGFPEELKARIGLITEWRNSVLHYKAKSYHLDAVDPWHERMESSIRKLGVENLLSLPGELQAALDRFARDIVEHLREAEELSSYVLLEELDDQ